MLSVTTELTARVEDVPYPKSDTFTEPTWCIVLTDMGKAKGTLPFKPQPGDTLTFSGEWTTYQGSREFKFRTAQLQIPVSERDRLRFVASRTKGVGPTTEALIWGKLGDGWRKLEQGDVSGLSAKVVAEFHVQIEALTAKAAEAEAVGHLMGRGLTQNMACAAWAKWEKLTLSVIERDCYALADLPNYGFGDADKLRDEFGIKHDDPRRVRGGIMYAMRQLTDTGDTVVTWDELRAGVVAAIGTGMDELIVDVVRGLFENETLVAFGAQKMVAIGTDYRDEVDILNWVDGKL